MIKKVLLFLLITVTFLFGISYVYAEENGTESEDKPVVVAEPTQEVVTSEPTIINNNDEVEQVAASVSEEPTEVVNSEPAEVINNEPAEVVNNEQAINETNTTEEVLPKGEEVNTNSQGGNETVIPQDEIVTNIGSDNEVEVASAENETSQIDEVVIKATPTREATVHTYDYRLTANQGVTLTQIFSDLGITNVDMNDLNSVQVSDPAKITLSYAGGVYTITSPAVFTTQEKLTVIFGEGDSAVTYIIKLSDSTIPAHDKSIVDNGDGTYTLELTITGEAERKINKINVIVIVDRSGSMGYDSGTSVTTYTQANNGDNLYGLVDGEYVQLHRLNGLVWVGPGRYDYDYFENEYYYNWVDINNRGTRYTGQRYSKQTENQTRLEATQDAVNNLANSLLSNNGGQNPNDTVEMALVSFAGSATTDVSKTTSYTTFSNAVNNLNAYGGTNWEAALKAANNINFGDSNPTYVIFFTDGAPTKWGNDNGNGQEQTNNMNSSYNAAKDDAKTLATKVKPANFYTIFAYGSSYGQTYLHNLTVDSDAAGAPAENNYSASNTAELQDAFNNVLANIQMAGIGTVELIDGTTEHVATSTGVSHLLSVDGSSFKYYRNDVEWTTIPAAAKASLNSNGEVVWNLSSLGVLDNDVTYKVTFRVWPSQETLDLIADLKNDESVYDSLDPAIKQYIDRTGTPGNYSYTLKTNTVASLTFTDNRPDTPTSGSATYANPDPVSTTAVEMLTISKSWENGIDDRDKSPVTLKVLKDGSTYEDIVLGPTAGENNTPKWEDNVYISIGIMTVDENGTVEVLSPGHDFSFGELGSDVYNWELKADTIRPMLVNGDLMLLIYSGTTQPTGTEGTDWYKINNGTAENPSYVYYLKGVASTTATLTAVNERRSVINVTKSVEYDANSAHFDDQLFNFEVTVQDAKGEEIWFSVKETNSSTARFITPEEDGLVVSGATREDKYLTASENIPESSISVEQFEGYKVLTYDYCENNECETNHVILIDQTNEGAYHYYSGYYKAPNNTAFTVSMKAGWNLRVINLLTGSTYTVKEVNVDDKFTYNQITYTPTTYKDADGNTINYVPTINDSNKSVSGEIMKANQAYDYTFVNKNVSTEVTVTKIWDDNNNANNNRPDSITLHLYNGTTEITQPTTYKLVNGNWVYTYTNLPVYNTAGTAITYTLGYTKADGTEVLGEDQILGYLAPVISGNQAAGFTVTNSLSTVSSTVVKVWSDNNNQDGKRPGSVSVLFSGDNKTYTLDANNNWTKTISNLPEYVNKQKVTYSWTEQNVPTGYSVSSNYNQNTNTTTITNTHTPETVQITVTKVWSDGENQDGIRPTSVTAKLMNGTTVVDSQVLNASNNWTYTWTKDKYANGSEIAYTIDEATTAVITGTDGVGTYAYEVKGTIADGFTITNTHTPETVQITVNKVWSDGNNQDGIRPTSVTAKLMNGTTVVDSQVLNASNNWTYTWTVDKNASGTAIAYTIDELTTTVITGTDGAGTYAYAVTGTIADGFTITNTHTPETVSVTVNKTWDDNNNQDGTRPSTATVQLYAGGNPVSGKTATVPTTNGEVVVWTGLAKYNNGTAIVYTVDETLPQNSGYASNVEKASDYVFNITNTHRPDSVTITVRKVWSDGENQDGIRPTSVTAKLMNGTTVVDSQVLDASNSWTYTWTVDKNASGSAIQYTVDELTTTVITGTDGAGTYAYAVTGSIADGFTITNTHTPETVQITVTKVWSDGENQDGIRPTSVTAKLMNGTTVVDSQVLDASNSWTYTWTVDKNANGSAIQYTVDEATTAVITGTDGAGTYAYEVKGTIADGFTITNTHTPEEVSVTVTKVWNDNDDQDGIRPDELVVTLSNGTEVTLTAADNWTATVEGLPKYDNGEEIEYTWTEGKLPEGYTMESNVTEGLETTITNKHDVEKADVTITKVWKDNDNQDGIRPDDITVTLYANGKEVETVKLNESNEWSYTWKQLDVKANGKDIEYTVSEVEVDGYTTKIDGLTITNTHETEKSDVTVTKVWEDNNDQDGIRPDEIEVTLYANGKEVETVKLNESNKWSYTWKQLDVKANGKDIEYTVSEVEVDGYTTKIDGLTITNTHETETTEVTVSKVWDDKDNYDGIRPDSVTIILYANGDKVTSVELSESNGWTYTWTKLDKKENGVDIEYSVEEEDIEGYEAEITGNMKDGFVVTNTHYGEGGDVPPTPPVNPKTGDNVYTYLFMLLISLFGLVKFTYSYVKNN